jgi:hypothetical protein
MNYEWPSRHRNSTQRAQRRRGAEPSHVRVIAGGRVSVWGRASLPANPPLQDPIRSRSRSRSRSRTFPQGGRRRTFHRIHRSSTQRRRGAKAQSHRIRESSQEAEPDCGGGRSCPPVRRSRSPSRSRSRTSKGGGQSLSSIVDHVLKGRDLHPASTGLSQRSSARDH